MNYESMTIEELTEENLRLMKEKRNIHEEQRKLNAIRDRKISLAEAEEKASKMTGPERDALTQVLIGLGGIPSAEKFGG